MYGTTHVFDTIEALYIELERHWLAVADWAIADHGSFNVALAGGSTPKAFYAKLASKAQTEEFHWDKTQLFFGDERCVPQDHPDSNYLMVQQSLLSHIPQLTKNTHAMFSEALSVEENVLRYQALLEDLLPQDPHGYPVFDLVLLGMGGDGHTASLFPDTAILEESKFSVAAQYVPKLAAWRMSLTFPTINAARNVALLVAGENKAEMLSMIAATPVEQRAQFPVQRVNPVGKLDWFLDVAAARLIPLKAQQ